MVNSMTMSLLVPLPGLPERERVLVRFFFDLRAKRAPKQQLRTRSSGRTMKLVGSMGFEPMTLRLSGACTYQAVLRSVNWWWDRADLNCRLPAYQTSALTRLSYSPTF